MLTKTGLGEALLAALGLYFCVRASSQLAGLAGATEEVFSGEISLAFFLPFAVLGLWGLLLVIFRRRKEATFASSSVAERFVLCSSDSHG